MMVQPNLIMGTKGTHDALAPASSWGDVMLARCGWARLGWLEAVLAAGASLCGGPTRGQYHTMTSRSAQGPFFLPPLRTKHNCCIAAELALALLATAIDGVPGGALQSEHQATYCSLSPPSLASSNPPRQTVCVE